MVQTAPTYLLPALQMEQLPAAASHGRLKSLGRVHGSSAELLLGRFISVSFHPAWAVGTALC